MTARDILNQEHLDEIRTAFGFEDASITDYLEGFGSKYVVQLTTNDGQYVLKGLYVNSETYLHNFLTVYKHLKAHNYPHIVNVKSSLDGKFFIEINGVICYLYDYIDGENLNGADEIYSHLGNALAKLHNIPIDNTLPNWDLRALIRDIINDRLPHIQRHDHLQIKDYFNHVEKLLSLPKALIHGDVASTNGIMNAFDNQMVLIDWDGCGVAPRILDLAYPLFGLLSDDLDFQWTNAKALFNAYMSHIDLTQEEKSCLIYATLLIPFNNVLIGDTKTKLEKIKWFMDKNEAIRQILNIS